jgi:hypothetical protein
MPFAEIRKIEPALAELERRIKAHARKHRGAERYCANRWWYGYWDPDRRGGFRREMKALVGWSAANPELRTSKAHDAAYEHLYRLLPNCRNCGCL